MNFPPNFDPSMLNNVDHNQMKMASDMMAGMSDEQLRSYASMMGMPSMDPQMMRNNINMMKGMNPHQFENMKNTAKNFPANTSTSGASSSQEPAYKRQTSAPVSGPAKTTKYSHIESLKTKGNDLFKSEKYDQAASAYFEAIIEIEELRSNNKKLQDDELDTLEISCRLNYANVKAKEEDYDIVMSQAKKVLNIKENGKAYFRLGQAQFHLKKYNEALENLERAIPLLPGDATVASLRDKVQKVLHAKGEDVKPSTTDTEERKTETTDKESAKKEEANQEENREEHKSKLKKKNAPKVDDLPLPPVNKAKEDKPSPPEPYRRATEEVKIEEEKIQSVAPPLQEPSKPAFGGFGSNVSEEKVKQGQQQLGSMSTDQLKTMTSMFKTMDNASLKSMLKSQSGMDLSDAQLETMKSMMTPEMLQNISKMDMSQMPKNPFGGAGASTGSSSSNRASAPASTAACSHDHDHSEHSHHHQEAQQPQGMAGMPTMPPGMDFKLEQAQAMIDMMIQNPEMLKNMVGMLGEGNPIARFAQNRSPEQLAKYLKFLRGALKAYGKVSPVVNFMKRYWQIIAGFAIAWVLIRVFKVV